MASRFTFVAAFFSALAGTAFGQLSVENWNNPAGGDWGVTTNWNPGPGPGVATFNLGSVAGYTTSLSRNWPIEGINMETDNAAIDLNGYTIQMPGIEVDTAAGQNGQLALVGPGTVELVYINEFETGLTDGVLVGTGGTGELTMNNALLEMVGAEEDSGTFNATGLSINNGGRISVGNLRTATISNATLNDGSFGGNPASLFVNQVTLTNSSSINAGDGTINLGNATLDDSTISAPLSGTVEGTVTLSDNAQLSIPEETISGTLYVLAGTKDLAGDLMMQNGTISVELNGQISDPISRPLSQDNGTLDFTLQNGFEPMIGEQFAVLAFDDPNATGTFATVNLPVLPAGGSWNISNLYTNGTISVVPEPVSAALLLFGLSGLATRRRR